MWGVGEETRVFLALGGTDLRRGINGLSILVENELEGELFSGDLFVFCNRKQNLVKALYWDSSGFCLWQKRLEKSRFKWPVDEREVLEIRRRELGWLLEGLDIQQAHDRLVYSVVS